MPTLSDVVDVDRYGLSPVREPQPGQPNVYGLTPIRSVDSPEYRQAFDKFCELYGREDVLSVSEAVQEGERYTLKARKGVELYENMRRGGAK